ncbi:hypothetical protein CR513_00035, partial [Mucuna pruriens]
MQEELNQFQKNDICTLVYLLEDMFIIGINLEFKNKLNENGKVVRNKACLEGIDFTKTFALVAILEFIRILLSFAAHNHMRLYQMDVKCKKRSLYKSIARSNRMAFIANPTTLHAQITKVVIPTKVDLVKFLCIKGIGRSSIERVNKAHPLRVEHLTMQRKNDPKRYGNQRTCIEHTSSV